MAKWNLPETVIKPTLFLLLFCALAPTAAAQGGGFSDLLRSVTGAIGGKGVVAATLGSYPPIRDPGLQHRLNQIGV